MRRRTVLRAGGAALLPIRPSFGDDAAGDAYESLGSVPVQGAKDGVGHLDGQVTFVATGDGFVTVDVSDPRDPTVVAERRDVETDGDDPLRYVWDLWPWEDRLVVAGPARAAADSAHGFALFDVADPADPEQVAYYPIDHHVHNAFFADETVYLVGTGLETEPVVMVDVADDDPEEVGRWSILDVEQAWADVPRRFRPLHDLYVQDGVAYLVYWDAGTWIVDVSDPSDPSVRGRAGGYDPDELTDLDSRERSLESLVLPGNHHYGQVDEDGDLLAIGKEAWAHDVDGERVGGPGGVDLYDVSDETDPTKLATVPAPASFDQTREGWFTTAHNFDLVSDRLYTSWYFGGVRLHDVSDPANPELLAWWRDPPEASFWTARSAVEGDFFVATSTGDPRKELSVSSGAGEARGGLYTFPDRPGTQPDPVDLTEPPDGFD